MPCGAWPCIVGSRANDEYWWILTIFEKGEWYIIEWKLKDAIKSVDSSNPFWSVPQPAVTAFGTRNLGETTPRTGCNCLDCWWRLGGLRWENTRDEEYWCLNGIDYDSDSSGMFMTALGIPVLLSRKNTIATNILPIGPVGMELSIKKTNLQDRLKEPQETDANLRARCTLEGITTYYLKVCISHKSRVFEHQVKY